MKKFRRELVKELDSFALHKAQFGGKFDLEDFYEWLRDEYLKETL